MIDAGDNKKKEVKNHLFFVALPQDRFL